MSGKRPDSEVFGSISLVVGGVMFVVFCAWFWIVVTNWIPSHSSSSPGASSTSSSLLSDFCGPLSSSENKNFV